jgi:hypothetical protein
MVAAGDPVESADITTITDYTTGKPLVRMIQATAQTGLLTGVDTILTFTTEDIDTHGFHDPVTNNTRITPSVAGYYRIDVKPVYAFSTTITSMNTFFRKNGSVVERSGNMKPASTNVNQANTPLTAISSANGSTDYFEGGTNFTGSANQATNGVVGSQSTIQVEFIRPL